MRLFKLTLISALAALLMLVPTASQAAMQGKPRIAALQVALQSKGFYKGTVDGIAGPLTRRGLVKFQRRNGIKANGKVSLRTRRAFGWLGRPSIGSRPMRRGHRGWDVSALQFLLQRTGFGAGRADGVFGPLTRQAVVRAQRAAEMTADGVAGPKTVSFLRRQASKPVDAGSDTELVQHNSGDGLIQFQRPVEGPIGDGFGAPREGGRRLHKGIDFPVPKGTRVGAAAPGTTIFAGWNSGGYGNLVVVQHAFGYTTWYAHLSKVTSWVGEKVSAGTRVGLVGSTGYSTGPHLHFEIRRYDTHLNPLPLLTAKPGATMARASASAGGGQAAGAGAGAGAPQAVEGVTTPPQAASAGYNWIAHEPLPAE